MPKILPKWYYTIAYFDLFTNSMTLASKPASEKLLFTPRFFVGGNNNCFLINSGSPLRMVHKDTKQ